MRVMYPNISDRRMAETTRRCARDVTPRPTTTALSTPARPVCGGCGGAGYYKEAVPLGHPNFGVALHLFVSQEIRERAARRRTQITQNPGEAWPMACWGSWRTRGSRISTLAAAARRQDRVVRVKADRVRGRPRASRGRSRRGVALHCKARRRTVPTVARTAQAKPCWRRRSSTSCCSRIQ